MVFLSPTELFFCGGGEYSSRPDTYIFNLTNEELENMCDMNTSRTMHGLIKRHSLIYVFGGNGDTAEKYDLSTDTWSLIENKIP